MILLLFVPNLWIGFVFQSLFTLLVTLRDKDGFKTPLPPYLLELFIDIFNPRVLELKFSEGVGSKEQRKKREKERDEDLYR